MAALITVEVGSMVMHAASKAPSGMRLFASRLASRPSLFQGGTETPADCATRLAPILSPRMRMTGDCGPTKVMSRPSSAFFAESRSPSLGFSEAWPQPTTPCEMQRSTMSCT